MTTSTVHYQGFVLRPLAFHLPNGYLSLVSVCDEKTLDQVLSPKSSVTADGLFNSGITAIEAAVNIAKHIVDDVRIAQLGESDNEHNAERAGKQSKEWFS